MLRAGEWKATPEGTWEKIWTCRSDKVPVLRREEEEGWAAIEYSLLPSKCDCHPASTGQCLPEHSPSPTPHVPDLRPPAIQEGWPHHSWEADHHSLSPPWPSHTMEELPSFGASAQHFLPPGSAPWPRNTKPSSAQPWEVCLHCREVWPVLASLGKSPLSHSSLGSC